MTSTSNHLSFQQVFRLIFVIFSLYLLQDVFFRWDGVSYYATFTDFIPGIALVSILWSIAAAMTTIIIWVSLRALGWFCQRMGWGIDTGNILLFTSIIISSGILFWVSKRLIFGAGSTLLIKLIVLAVIIFAAVIFTFILRGKLSLIQERITPLVWIFSVILFISFPIVIYITWDNVEDKILSQEITQSDSVLESKPNIILITFDALTARDMSVYGYNRPTTPFISKWSETASVFTKTSAQANYTYPTTLSLMTGKRPWTHLQYNPNGRVRITPQNLPKILKKNGYYNIALVQNVIARVNNLGISESFDVDQTLDKLIRPSSLLSGINDLLYEFAGTDILLYDWITKHDFLLGMVLSKISKNIFVTQYPPKRVFNEMLSILSDNPPEPYFIWAHLIPPHDAYLPPNPYMNSFYSSTRLKSEKEQYKITQSEDRFNMKLDQETLDILRARYDEFIRYCDEDFKYIINLLEKGNKLDNTVIILSSDHGESFEHNYLTHGGPHLYEAVTHIPLIIKEPGQTKGLTIDDRVEQIDIATTILDMANIPAPSWMEGRSLIPLLRNEKLSERPSFAMSLDNNPSKRKMITKGSIAVWDGDYKLIHVLQKDRSMLFNIKQDPDELHNLIDEKPEILKRLKQIIIQNLASANDRMGNK